MLKNIGTVDRVARLFVAGLLIFLAASPHVILAASADVDRWLEYLLYAVGGYFLITAILGSCLIYRVLDVDSRMHAGSYHSGEDVFDGRGGN